MRLRRTRRWSNARHDPGKILFPERIRLMSFVMGAIFILILGRLFQLQVVQGDDYSERIKNQSVSTAELIARRGDILVKDTKSGEYIQMALNTSVDELRIDSVEIPDKKLAADLLAPLVFSEKEYEECEEDYALCPEGLIPEALQNPELLKLLPEDSALTAAFIFPDYREALQKKKEEIFRKIDTKNRYVLIKRQISPEVSTKTQELKKKFTSEHEADRRRLYAAKQDPKTAVPDYFKGVILVPKPIRYYPEGQLASQVLGFLNRDGSGQYGVEEALNEELTGKKGEILGRTDTFGRSIGLSVDDFRQAEDGSNLVLTIDRIIQQKAEELLSAAVEQYRSDSGQIIVMDPKNGFILAMANFPTFDPNKFGEVYALRRTTAEDASKIFKTTPLFQQDPKADTPEEEYVPATYDDYVEARKLEIDPEFYIYENFVGPGAYLNKTIQAVYEPGSVFKPLVMSIALNENEVTPSTQYKEDKPVEVDVGGRLVPIRNADGHYKGWQTMTNVLERSANLGMVFVARTLGKGVMYENIKNFGFGRETFVELAQELSGTLNYYTRWSTAALFNHAFGQGIATTPLQVIRAWCAMANGGKMPEPHIISEIHHADGEIEKIEPEYESVLRPDTATTITSMLVSAVNVGYSGRAKVPGYNIAGKTGTSQIARTDGVGYEPTNVVGNVITSFAGYGPAEDPRFVILVKFDRPRFGSTESLWGETTAAPVFQDLAEFLLDYYGIPPQFAVEETNQ